MKLFDFVTIDKKSLTDILQSSDRQFLEKIFR